MRNWILIGICLAFLSQGLRSQNGILEGRVFDTQSNESLPFASIRLQDSPFGALADSNGFFRIEKISPGLYNVVVNYTGYKPFIATEIQVFNNKAVTLEVAMEEEGATLAVVNITASPFTQTPESPTSLKTIGVNEIERNPGGNRDISKVIQSLPGVASTVGFRNDMIIRGGSPNENRFFLDGIEVPNINHFATQGASGGPTGMINVNFIREVDFYTGAFPGNRGNSLSSVMDMKLKNGRADRLGANMTVGSSDIGLTLEGPLGPKTTFLASGRRSYLQGLFSILGLPFLPTYNDFQFKTRTQLSPKSELIVLGLGAIDKSSLNLAADSTPTQRYILDYLPEYKQWNYTLGAAYKQYLANGNLTFAASRNMLNNESYKFQNNDDATPDNLILRYGSQEMENKFRLEHSLSLGAFKVNYGATFEYVRYTNSTYNRISTPFGLDTLDFSSALDLTKYSVFGSISRKLAKEKLSLSFGVRADGSSYSATMANPLRQISPRLSASYAMGPHWKINANAGTYYQLPAYTVLGYRDNQGTLLNRENGITYIQCSHGVAGLEYLTTFNSRFTLEGFYKKYDHYPFATQEGVSLANLGGDFGVVGNTPATSTSQGRAYGLELMAQQKLWKGFFGILSYTFVRSEFTDSSGTYRPSSWDNRHIVTFTGGKKFKRNWELGLRWRLYGGAPYTPYDLSRSSLISVWEITHRGLPDYTQVNTQRLPASHQLDLRLDKKWYFQKWALNLYFDVQNVYNFQSKGVPTLTVERDANDQPVVDPSDPTRYKVRLEENLSGTVLPSIGVVIEL